MKNVCLIILIALGLTRCNNNPENDYIANQIKLLNQLADKFGSKEQIYSVDSKNEHTIITDGGIRIKFHPKCLETINGKAIGDSIQIKIQECFNQIDFLKYNVQTVDKCGLILISGGAFNISMTSDSNELELKKNCDVEVVMPTLSDNKMELFYGLPNSTNQVIWERANQPFTRPQIMDELETVDIIWDSTNNINYYNPIKIDKLGWINCDRFIDVKEKFTIKYKFSNKFDTLISNQLLIFWDINSLMSESSYKINDKEVYSDFKNVPTNIKMRFVSYCLINKKIKAFHCDLSITNDTTINVIFEDVTENRLNEIINKK
jgi:hypothetical protein